VERASAMLDHRVRFHPVDGWINTPGKSIALHLLCFSLAYYHSFHFCSVDTFMATAFGPKPYKQDVSCQSWNKNPLRCLFIVVTPCFAQLELHVPSALKTGRGGNAVLRDHQVFSQPWLIHFLFTGFVRFRTGTSDLVEGNIPILFSTNPSKEFRVVGHYSRMRDDATAGLAPEVLDTPEPLLNETDIASLKATKDTFFVIIRQDIGNRSTTHWIGMMIRKAIIHFISICDKKCNRSAGEIVTLKNIVGHIWNEMPNCKLKVFWESQKHLAEYCKNNVFKAPNGQNGEYDLRFLTSEYRMQGMERLQAYIYRESCWTAALGSVDKETVCAVHCHLRANANTPHGGLDKFEMLTGFGEGPAALDDSPVDLPTLMAKSIRTGVVTPQLLYSLSRFHYHYMQTRMLIGRLLAQNLSVTNENSIFGDICQEWGFEKKRISRR
jgi:hypothetical protein